MSQQRQSTSAIAYPGGFDTQVDFDTPLLAAAMTARVPLSDEAVKLDLITTKERIMNCSARVLASKLLLTRMYRLSFSVKAVPSFIHGTFGWGFGVVAGDTVTLLPEGEFQPPPTTLLWGHVGSDIGPFILPSMVLMKISISAAITGYQVNYEFLGKGVVIDASGFAWPACPEVDVARLKDGSFIIDGTERNSILTSWDFNFDNKPDPADPFTLASEDITRNERADEIDANMKVKLQSEFGDEFYVAGTSNPLTEYPWSARIGSLTDGVTIAAPNSTFEVETGSFEGGFRRSNYSYLMDPLYSAGDPNSPCFVTRET